MFGGASKCPKCGKSVYHAEEMLVGGNKYHRLCVRCSACNKMVDSTSLSEKDNKIYCKGCYGKNFGPKGYGYGGGAGTLSNTGQNVVEGKVGVDSTSKPTGANFCPQCGIPASGAFCQECGNPISKSQQSAPRKVGGGSISNIGGGDKCPRCGKTVYHAEKLVAAGKTYHNSCCVCAMCKKRLDSTSLCEHENEIYCKNCYGANFGAKGYGYGQGAGALQRTQ